jgi:hypothetical protein
MKKQIKTSELISNFMFENGNPIMAEQNITDNGETITITLEGIASRKFPKPYDFDEYFKSLEG